MKHVTIDSVRERIAELEMVHGHGELSLRGEFELACLRQLLATMEAQPVAVIDKEGSPMTRAECNDDRIFAICCKVGTPLYPAPPLQVTAIDDDVRSVVALLENNEWAEHCTKTELGQRLESEITRLHNWLSAQPAPVVPDEMTPEMMRAVQLNSELGAYAVSNLSGAYDLFSEFWKVARSAAMLQGAEQSPVTDNTAQQFEALATRGKSEHLLNAERIAREAKALSDRLKATSEVNPRVSGWSERQQKVIAYSLWSFSCTAYQKANQAAQANNKDMFDRFIRDARCAEEIREEFTSVWGGNI